MKLRKIEDIELFIAAVNKCEGDVYLTSTYGDKFSMKSQISRYIAIGALLGDHGDELEIWCERKGDESHIIRFLAEHPELN